MLLALVKLLKAYDESVLATTPFIPPIYNLYNWVSSSNTVHAITDPSFLSDASHLSTTS